MNLIREIIAHQNDIKKDNLYSYNTPIQYYSFYEGSIAKFEHLANTLHTGFFISEYEVLMVFKNEDRETVCKKFYSTKNIHDISHSHTYKKLNNTPELVITGDSKNLEILESSNNVTTLRKAEFHIAISDSLINMNFNGNQVEFIELDVLSAIKQEIEDYQKAAA